RTMKFLIRALLAALALVAPAFADDTPLDPAAGYFQIVHSVVPGVWVLTQPKFQVQPDGNVTVIEQSDGLVLVDAGGSAGSGRRIVEMVRGLSAKPVKAVIISQWHGDKAQGLTEILKAWPNARTISTAVTQAHLAKPATMNTPGAPDAAANDRQQKLIKAFSAQLANVAAKQSTATMRDHYAELSRVMAQWARDMDGTLTIPTRETFAEHLAIDDPRAPVRVMFLGRADTDGDAIVWLPKQRILVTGETVILPFPYGFQSYPSDWIGVLKKLRVMPFRILIPGHGLPQTNGVQIDHILAALEDIRAQVRPLANLTLEQAQAGVDATTQRHIFAGDDPWLAHWFDEFWLKPIIASAYKEAKGQLIVQDLRG
ncbi:MAG TPA: MBL fold metallo-hydrolase, partial [Rhizomicrobium sp.]|nr:MBL fold metallo-hydrolase [Rhizomicrobium sp.]